MTSNSISEEKYKNLDKLESKSYVKEWSCTCNECKHKWHYLDDVERQIKTQELSNAFMGMGFCCNPCALSAASNANTQLKQQRTKLSSCPECGSSNVTKIQKFFKKQ